MLHKILIGCLLASFATAQQTITVGGTSSAPSRAATGKANLFTIDQTSLMTSFEMYLDVPSAEALTFFIYRSSTRAGPAALEFTTTVNVPGGIGASWYSSGPLQIPLVSGNSYLLGVAWNGTVTYHYDRGTAGSPIPIGTWERGSTLRIPLPPTQSIGGVDVAQYHQRFTVLPLLGVVEVVGTPCSGSGGTPPRLVATNVARLGGQFALDLVEAVPSTPALFVLGIGPTMTTPIPLLGCSLWLDPRNPLFGVSTTTSASGTAQLPMTVPNQPGLVGFPLSVQSAVAGTTFDFTNALDIQVIQ